VHEFPTLLYAVQVVFPSFHSLIVSGAALPGFFADQSIEHLDFMIKTVYMTSLYTAHVIEPSACSDPE